jgi:hypothetical protein
MRDGTGVWIMNGEWPVAGQVTHVRCAMVFVEPRVRTCVWEYAVNGAWRPFWEFARCRSPKGWRFLRCKDGGAAPKRSGCRLDLSVNPGMPAPRTFEERPQSDALLPARNPLPRNEFDKHQLRRRSSQTLFRNLTRMPKRATTSKPGQSSPKSSPASCRRITKHCRR